MAIKNMKDDFKDGVALINLMEIISGKSLGRYNKHPRIINQKLENLNIAIDFIKSEGIKLVNVGSDDINSGNMRIILGLVWTLILRYEIKSGEGDENGINDLLKWVQSKIPEYNITGFTKDWNDGRAVCALVDAIRPGLIPDHASMNPDDKLANATKGIDVAEAELQVDKLVLPEEMVHPKVDKLAMMTYIAQYRNIPDQLTNASRCRAYGPGLVEGIVDNDAPFKVEKPSDVEGKIEVKVEGPINDTPVEVKDNGDNTYDVVYKPSVPGKYKVHVTLDGIHIKGSIFHVTVLAEESLGGEGKIRVFYSTTSAMQKQRSDFQSLQSMLEAKKVHLRADFEPWIAVDVMERDDREAVYRRAGSRTLPIVFIDDKYIGDYDICRDLNEVGKLDELLNMKSQSLVSEEEHLERLKTMKVED